MRKFKTDENYQYTSENNMFTFIKGALYSNLDFLQNNTYFQNDHEELVWFYDAQNIYIDHKIQQVLVTDLSKLEAVASPGFTNCDLNSTISERLI